MATITVRDVPGHVHQHLKRRAEENNRSLNQEVLRILEGTISGASESDREAARRACKNEQERTPNWPIEPDEMKRAMREGLV